MEERVSKSREELAAIGRRNMRLIQEEEAGLRLFDDLIEGYLRKRITRETFRRKFLLTRSGARWKSLFALLDAEMLVLAEEGGTLDVQIQEIEETLRHHITLKQEEVAKFLLRNP